MEKNAHKTKKIWFDSNFFFVTGHVKRKKRLGTLLWSTYSWSKKCIVARGYSTGNKY